jgi:hypothetical protein
MHYFEKRDEEFDIFEKFVFLKLFQPKNFGRISPLVYVFWISLFTLMIGIMFIKFLWFLIILGGFMLIMFLLYAVFWKWEII